MMYLNKMAFAIKSNGKVLREFGDIIYVPYGSEYSIYLKNLNSVRAEVDISIDGKKVCDDGLVINANSELNIERFIKELNSGNRFKFIERTGKIEKHRGVGSEDGLIRIAFKFEKVQPKPVWVWPTYVYPPVYQPGHWEWKPGYYPNGYPYIGGVTYRGDTAITNAVGSAGCNININNTTNGVTGDQTLTGSASSAMRGMAQNAVFTASASATPSPGNDVGITVAGSVSDQKFQTVNSFATEDEEHVMILRLLGETEGGKTVKEPVTVKAKARCSTCGRNNKATAAFCSECGTALEIV